jgi:Rrf2 family transcriptional regulator, cysteine metabolism repressor
MLNPDPNGRNSPARRTLAAGVPLGNSDRSEIIGLRTAASRCRRPANGPASNHGPQGEEPPPPGIQHSEDRPLAPTTRAKHHGTGAVAFSTKGEYGVRLMVQLGRRYGNGPASLTEIAADEDLPRAYLEQLVTSLRDAGLVTATRGARGGYELTAPPSQIRMGQVLRALEGPIAPMFCASDDPDHAECARTARCTVNLLWLKVRDAIAGTLDSLTLADLVPVRHIVLDPREPATSRAGIA